MNDPYQITIGGVKADPYRIARAYGLGGAEAQALKKILRIGKKHKSRREDAMEVISTMQRIIEMDEEDNKASNVYGAATRDGEPKAIGGSASQNDGWIPHIPGHPMPCDGRQRVAVSTCIDKPAAPQVDAAKHFDWSERPKQLIHFWKPA